MEHRLFFVFFCICASLTACTIERAEEQITDWHVEGIKKTSLWVFPNGEILKRNEWYHDGAKEFEIPYKDGAPHGEFKRWTIMGDLALTGYYQMASATARGQATTPTRRSKPNATTRTTTP